MKVFYQGVVLEVVLKHFILILIILITIVSFYLFYL